MELAILGAVGLLGYVLSEKDVRAQTPDQPVPKHMHGYPWGPGTEVQKLMEADRQNTKARWEQSVEPHVTGVVSPNTKPGGMQPFFSSAAKQHTNNEIKQRRLENFTGALDLKTSRTGVYSRKREVPSMFKPEWNASPVNSSGATAGTPFGIDQGSRYVPSLRQNNVLPTQQVRVGPGLGVAGNVAAADGFHPMLRIMPQNVNEYRLNNLAGGIVPGASAIAGRPSDMPLEQFGPPRYWEQQRRPTLATKASVNAASERPNEMLAPCGGRLIGEDYYGTGGREGSYTAATQATRDRYDNNLATHETNVTGAIHGIGAFAKATFDPTRLDAQQREQFQAYDGMLTGDRAPKAQETYLLPETNRSIHTTDVVGNPASAVEVGSTRPQDLMDRTLREHMHPQSQPGIAAPYIKGHSVTATDKWLDREAKRYTTHLVDWMPPAHMPTDVRVPGLVQVKPRLELQDVPSLPTTATPLNMAAPGHVTRQIKLPSENARLDLGIASAQLASNPLHLKVR